MPFGAEGGGEGFGEGETMLEEIGSGGEGAGAGGGEIGQEAMGIRF